MKLLSLLLCTVILLLTSTVRAEYTAYNQQQERRIADLENKVSELQRKSPTTNGVDISGARDALWRMSARYGRRIPGGARGCGSFSGLFFSAITVIVLLVKNSNTTGIGSGRLSGFLNSAAHLHHHRR